jgi:hypothetical protein
MPNGRQALNNKIHVSPFININSRWMERRGPLWGREGKFQTKHTKELILCFGFLVPLDFLRVAYIVSNLVKK